MRNFLEAVLLQLGAVFGYGWALIKVNIVKPLVRLIRKERPDIEEMPSQEIDP